MQLMVMQAKIDTNPKHCAAMTHALRINWAKARRCVVTFSRCITTFIIYNALLNRSNAVTVDKDDFQVVLD